MKRILLITVLAAVVLVSSGCYGRFRLQPGQSPGCVMQSYPTRDCAWEPVRP